MIKFHRYKPRDYIFIFLTATIFSTVLLSKSFAEENIFIVDNVKVQGAVDINFSREKYIDKALLNSFEMLMSKILLSGDFNKIGNTKLNEIKNLINSFQVLEESYSNNIDKSSFKFFYSEIKIKRFLVKKNISFSQPKKISALFYPVLFIDEDLQNFSDNYFYKNWKEIEIKNESISFVLPIEDLDDIKKVKEIKNNLEELNVLEITEKYNISNYVFAFIQYEKKKINAYIKTNFNNNEVGKNFSYEIQDIDNEGELKKILKNLKTQINDIWKGENIINLSTPLSIKVKFQNKNHDDFEKLKKIFYEISIIKNYSIEEININYAYFKIYYYGNPRRLTNELIKFGYELKNEQGKWIIYNE